MMFKFVQTTSGTGAAGTAASVRGGGEKEGGGGSQGPKTPSKDQGGTVHDETETKSTPKASEKSQTQSHGPNQAFRRSGGAAAEKARGREWWGDASGSGEWLLRTFHSVAAGTSRTSTIR